MREWATNGFNKALQMQQPIALSMVARLRRVYPDKTPEQLIKFLDKTYLGTVTASGTGAGMAAAVPNGAVQIPAAISDLGTFLESSVLYVLAVAEIHGVDVEDFERRKFLVMTALLGDTGTKTVTQALGKKTIPYWSKTIINKIPMDAIRTVNKMLDPRFVTKYGTKQGVLVLGKQLPLALGVIVGAGGNAAFSHLVVRSTKQLLGNPPDTWDHLDLEHDEMIEDEGIGDLPTN
ncbi:hypothetical protein FYJ43_04710 [Cutibacterium sp. WCA-380-WT-3A]|uniref:EcsC family protein n=2 Tax=Cutibacterium porci TaxID=2605781 RepID=A0A7K0J616_9ACTN|nr:hypothetical protein [Cutibacterium porci]